MSKIIAINKLTNNNLVDDDKNYKQKQNLQYRGWEAECPISPQDDEKVLCDSFAYNLSDNGIADCCKVYGFTIEKNELVLWKDKRHKDKGFIKYVSDWDPKIKSTTGDPYHDGDKVLGNLPAGTLLEAKHPLVAACPEFGVNMEKLVLSKNQNTSKELGGSKTDEISHTIAIATSSSHSETTSMRADISPTLTNPFSISGSISHDWTTSVSQDHSDSDTSSQTISNSWATTLGINTAETAFLNGNVRYINLGTAPIYEVRPTLDFVLKAKAKNDSETIATVVAKTNTVANLVWAGDSYPEKAQNAIAFSASDDFNSQPIKMNFEQVAKLEKTHNLEIQTTQVEGLFGEYDVDNQKILINSSQTWTTYMTQIYERTACITIAFKNGTIQRRRVSARKEENYQEQTQPELTLRQAIKIAFLHNEVAGIKQKISWEEIPPCVTDFIVDPNTGQQIRDQQNANQELNIFDIKLMQGMNIFIIEKSDQTIFQEVKEFLTSHNQENPIYIDEKYWNKSWQNFLPIIANKLTKKIGIRAFERVKINFSYYQNTVIAENSEIDGKTWKNMYCQVGSLKSQDIVVHFNNVYRDKDALEKSLKTEIAQWIYPHFNVYQEENWTIENKAFFTYVENQITQKFGEAILAKMHDIKYTLNKQLPHIYFAFINMTFEFNNKNIEIEMKAKIKKDNAIFDKNLLAIAKKYQHPAKIQNISFDNIFYDIKNDKKFQESLKKLRSDFHLSKVDVTGQYIYYKNIWKNTASRYDDKISENIADLLFRFAILSVIFNLLKYVGDNENVLERDLTIEKIISFIKNVKDSLKNLKILNEEGYFWTEINALDEQKLFQWIKNKQYYHNPLIDLFDSMNYENLTGEDSLSATQNDINSINNLTRLKWTDTLYRYNVKENWPIIFNKETQEILNVSFIVNYSYEYTYRVLFTTHHFYLDDPKNWDVNLYFTKLKQYAIDFFAREYDWNITTSDSGKKVVAIAKKMFSKTLPYNWSDRIEIDLMYQTHEVLSIKPTDSWILSIKIDRQEISAKEGANVIKLKLKNIT